MSRLSNFLSRALAVAASLLIATAADAKGPVVRPVKVMVITLFGPEAAPWLKQLPLKQTIRVPGCRPSIRTSGAPTAASA